MLTMIEPRSVTVDRALIEVVAMSWNGTIAQARLSPTASVSVSSTRAISTR